MNKDIQTLIERERNEAYHKEISCLSITDEEYQGYRDGYDKGIDKGIEIALSLFKWRKVSEELPKMETVLIKVMCHYPNGNHEVKVTTGTILTVDKCNLDNELIEEITRSYKAIEWMPIPQID